MHGEVRDIGIRATRIITNDNIDILVPNSEFVTGRAVNWTLGDNFSRLRVPFGVDYGVDKERVKTAALEAAAELPFTLALEGELKPQVWLVALAESSLNFELVVWLTAQATKRPNSVKAAYVWALDDALRRHRIGIPFPNTDLNIRSLFGLEGLDALRAMPASCPWRTPSRLPPADRRATMHWQKSSGRSLMIGATKPRAARIGRTIQGLMHAEIRVTCPSASQTRGGSD